MKNITRALVIIGTICILVIIFCLSKYFHKYYVITKFQQKVEEIERSGNYKIIEDYYIFYIKDNVCAERSIYDFYYIIINKNTNQSYMISLEGIIEAQFDTTVYNPNISKISNRFSIKNTEEETTLWSIIDSIVYADLSTEEINGKKCYKLYCISDDGLNGKTVYFDKQTYMPVAYSFGENITYVEIIVGTVTDEDVSPEAIYKKLMELTS